MRQNKEKNIKKTLAPSQDANRFETGTNRLEEAALFETAIFRSQTQLQPFYSLGPGWFGVDAEEKHLQNPPAHLVACP